jgi:hypothetical protein
VKGLAHAPSREEALGKLILFTDYPKMDFIALLGLDFLPIQSNPVLGYLLWVKAMAHTLSREAETFLEQAQFVTADAIREKPAIVPAEAGVYGWWLDQALGNLSEASYARGGLHLLYIGIAPSAPPKGGVKPRTLRDRLLNHCRGPMATSTLRRTLAALLKANEGFSIERAASGKSQMSADDEARLTRWMTEHARVTWLTTPVPWILEKEFLDRGPRLPLNIRGSSDPFRKRLSALRAASLVRPQDDS